MKLKLKKILSVVASVLSMVMVMYNVTPTYAYVENSKDVSGYGELLGWQSSLYEQDYNEICWVNMGTTLSDWESGMRTAIDYQPVETESGYNYNSNRVTRYSSSCSAVCYLSSYGLYDGVKITLYSSHWIDGNGESEIVYLADTY
jgi:hypothetical protein